MILLFLRNKCVEFGNALHWLMSKVTSATTVIKIERRFVISVIIIITAAGILTGIGYLAEWINPIFTDNAPLYEYTFVGLMYSLIVVTWGIMFVLFIMVMCCLIGSIWLFIKYIIEWLKDNIQLARNGTKVKSKWSKNE